MNDKKKEEEIKIESNIEETSHGMKKDLRASLDIKGKGIRIKTERAYVRFPVGSAEKAIKAIIENKPPEKGIIEKANEGIKDNPAEISKAEENAELKMMHVEYEKFNIDIPALIQEVLITTNKELLQPKLQPNKESK